MLKQMIERLMFKCEYCDVPFKYGETRQHAESCKGLNFTCPNKGCSYSRNMPTAEALKAHVKQCEHSELFCPSCELKIVDPDNHNCIHALKKALSEQIAINTELRTENEKL